MNADKMQGHGSKDGEQAVLLVGMEMSLKTWRLALAPAGAVRHRQVSVEGGSYGQVHAAVARARERFGVGPQGRVILCYEAGREGFHPYRVLVESGYEVWVVDSSSIEVERRQRRAKNDVLDAGKLVALMQRQWRGEQALRVVRVPSREQEDERQRSREREELRVERGRLRMRMQSLAFTQGEREFPKSVPEIEQWLKRSEQRLGAHLVARLERELGRLRVVSEQLRGLESELHQSVERATTRSDRVAAQLRQLKGIGERSGWVLGSEVFGWRQFRNRREVGAMAGLVPTPYDSGESQREQGISKAGNKRVRRVLVELAWQWLRYQPESASSQWFRQRFAQGKRSRRLGIVALARRLLVELWHYLEHGVIPRGAQLKA
ncbi:MAG TPA: IS110 family transposase [Gammaproteobacteria bacterium]|nr:IS110 family transposase [Gammaproteobacteria bacterium]